MRPDGSVAADPAGGVVRVGEARLAMSAAGPAGAWRFGGPAGPVLRPLRFGERTEVVAAASALARPRDSVAAAVLSAATVSAGEGERTQMEVLALWLAGAAWDAPQFIETALLVGRAAGWPLQDLLVAPATEVDRLAVHLSEEQRGGGAWKSIVFLPPPAVDPIEIRARFVDELLRRAGSSAEREDVATAEASKASGAVASTTKELARSATTSSPEGNGRKPRFRVLGAETRRAESSGDAKPPQAGRTERIPVVEVRREKARAAAPERDQGCHAFVESESAPLHATELTRTHPEPSARGRDDRMSAATNASVTRSHTSVAVELHASPEFIATEHHDADGPEREFFTAQTPPRAATQTAHDHTDDLFTALQAAAPAAEPFDVARELAALLDDEADLRGLDR